MTRPPPGPPAADPSSDLRILSNALADAGDDRVRRAVAMVDAMPVRGAADALIAKLRPRLARLRPARSLNFTRLLFLPLDPVIMPAEAWQRGAAGVPRSALGALAAGVRDDWPASAEATLAAIDERLVGATTAHLDQVLELGALLWREAAPRLLASAPPPTWQETTALDPADHLPIVQAVAMVLTHGAAVVALNHGPWDRARADAQTAELCRLAVAARIPAETLAPFATMLAGLMLRSPRADRVLAMAEAAGGGDKQLLVGTQMALDFVLGGLVRAAASDSLAHAADAMGKAGAMLARLDTMMAFRPAPRERLQEVRRALDQACRRRLAAALTLLAEPSEDPPLSATEREAMAGDARRFAQFAGQIDHPAPYDALLLDCAARLTGPSESGPSASGPSASGPSASGLTPVEGARLAAILVAPQAPGR